MLTIFPAFLAISGLTMQTLINKSISIDIHPSYSTIIIYTAVSIMALLFAAWYSNNNAFSFSPQSVFGPLLAQLSAIDRKLFGVLMAVSEEQFFRGFITSYFLQRIGTIPAVVASAAVFGIFHFAVYGTAPSALTFVFLAGAILSFVTIKTGLISPAMMAHVFNNWMSM